MSGMDPDRTTALALLTQFRHHILPGALRRLATWKGIPHRLLRDWLDDVEQELAVDCLEHASVVARLSDRQRHARWMRRTEAVIYRLRRNHRGSPAIAKEEPAAPDWQHDQPPDVQLPALVTLNNGRTNIVASIRQSGQARRHLRRQLDELAAQLGWDDERFEFWRARVVEALTGLAADLLVGQHTIRSLNNLPSPAPERRRARLRRLSRRFPIQPSTRAIRSVLRPWTRRNKHPEPSPRELLEQATRLRPDAGATWLWLFEACCHDHDAAAAMRAVWHARRCGGVSYAAIVLARARVFELRGLLPGGIKLLRNKSQRRPREEAIVAALTLATDTVAHQPISARQRPCQAHPA